MLIGQEIILIGDSSVKSVENMKGGYKMESINQQIENLGYEIAGDIDHGECFYEENMLNRFLANLDKMKKLAKEYYQQNKAEMEDDEE